MALFSGIFGKPVKPAHGAEPSALPPGVEPAPGGGDFPYWAPGTDHAETVGSPTPIERNPFEAAMHAMANLSEVQASLQASLDRGDAAHAKRIADAIMQNLSAENGLLALGLIAAGHSQDWTSVAFFAGGLRACRPSDLAGYKAGLDALRAQGRTAEADSLVLEFAEKFPDDVWAQHEACLAAWSANAWRDVVRIAARLRQAAPSEADGYRLAIEAFRRLTRLEEAGALLDAALSIWPGAEWALQEAAQLAKAQESWHAAALRSAEIRRHYPQQADGYRIGLFALRKLDALGEAEKLAGESAALFPDADWLLQELAMLARIKGDWPLAARHAAALRKQDSAERAGYVIGIAAHRALGELDAADHLAAEAEAIFGQANWLVRERTKLEQARKKGDSRGRAQQ